MVQPLDVSIPHPRPAQEAAPRAAGTDRRRFVLVRRPRTRLEVLIIGLNYAPEPTGIAPYTTATARFIADAGHDVHVVTGYPHYPQWRIADGYHGLRYRDVVEGVRITRVRHPVPRRAGGLRRIGMEAVFAAHVAAAGGRRPDVVVAVSPSLLSVASALRWRKPGRTSVGVVTQDLYGRAVAEAWALGGGWTGTTETLERALLRRADGVVAIHDQFRASLCALGVREDRITTIRNWTHTGHATEDPSRLRRELGWADDEVVALHAGNMGGKQGLENVVDAAREAERLGLRMRFVLLGAGNQRASLERLGAGARCLQFLDPLPAGRFETALRAADVLLLNERPEVAEMCVPSKLTSYFASGRPVVAATNALSAAAREVEDSRAGVRVEPFDPGALVTGVGQVAQDADLAARLGRAGLRYSAERLGESTARAAYVDWIERLAPRGLEHDVPVPVSVPREMAATSR